MKKKLRRGAILVMVLVLLFSNTMGAKADTGEPTTTVNSYVGLYTALEKAKNGDVIGIKGVITIPSPDALNYATVTLKRMEAGAKIVFSDTYRYGGRSTVKKITFDGNSSGENPVGGTTAFVEVNGNVEFTYCNFKDCFNENDV